MVEADRLADGVCARRSKVGRNGNLLEHGEQLFTAWQRVHGGKQLSHMTAMLRIELLDDLGVLTHQCNQRFPTEYSDRKGTPRFTFRRTNPGVLLRSEEHTSELQSLMRISYAVFCLKKKISTKSNTK